MITISCNLCGNTHDLNIFSDHTFLTEGDLRNYHYHVCDSCIEGITKKQNALVAEREREESEWNVY